MRKLVFALGLVGLVGCAKGGVGQLAQGDANDVAVDGKVFHDAAEQSHDDAHVFNDAHMFNDAHVFNDACVPAPSELLANPAFDLAPIATGWTEVQVNGVQVVTASSPQSAPNSLYLGDYTGFGVVADQIYQDVAIPVGTTSLVLTGYYGIATAETTTTTVYDTATVGLTQTNGTPINTALSVSNLTNTGNAYVTLNHSFPVTGLSGTTIRLRLTSTSDDTLGTAFFFDTLSLTATHCP